MKKEEYLVRFSMLEQEANKREEQLNLINQNILELEALKLSLEKIEKEKEVLANLGRGIYFLSKVEDNELFVNIGSGIVLKKNKKEACEIISSQLEELDKIKSDVSFSIEKINSQLQNLLVEIQQSQETQGKG